MYRVYLQQNGAPSQKAHKTGCRYLQADSGRAAQSTIISVACE